MKTRDLIRTALILLTACFSALLAPSAVPAATIALTKTDYPVGLSSVSVVPADFDGDGKLDLAVSNVGSGTVSILLGNGDGTFQEQVMYPVGEVPQYAVSGDFNGDGKLDLAVSVIGIGGVAVLLGNGDGTFQAPINSPADARNAIVAGDFNGDGRLDVAIANVNGPDLSVLLGNGDGTFQPSVNYITSTNPFSETASITTADFNGDGKLDLAVTNHVDSTISVLLGNGNGTFQDHVEYGTEAGPYWVTAADFNGDGNLDLAVSNQGYANQNPKSVSIFLGKGDGTFPTHVNYTVGDGPVSVTSSDFNGDGKLDLITANVFDNTVSLLFGNGDGTFQSRLDVGTNVIGIGGGPASVATGDFNADGRMDFAVSYDGGTVVSVFLQEIGPIAVTVDIKPGEFPNLITISNDPNRIEVITVAILTTPTFDATEVDPTTVRFGKTGTEASPVQVAFQDADGDGTVDLVLHFRTQVTGLRCGDSSASLTGQTVNGQAIQGSDTIVTIRGGVICR